MHAVYELWLWIMQLILLRNPDFHHGLAGCGKIDL
jgi:hypothetical protein